MRQYSSFYNTLNPEDKWKTLPQHQNIYVHKKRLMQQQQNTSNLALNGANFLKRQDYLTDKMKAQAATRQRQYKSNRSYLQFTEKAKIHVPIVKHRLDYSLPSSKTNVNQFMKSHNRNARYNGNKNTKFATTMKKYIPNNYYTINSDGIRNCNANSTY